MKMMFFLTIFFSIQIAQANDQQKMSELDSLVGKYLILSCTDNGINDPEAHGTFMTLKRIENPENHLGSFFLTSSRYYDYPVGMFYNVNGKKRVIYRHDSAGCEKNYYDSTYSNGKLSLTLISHGSLICFPKLETMLIMSRNKETVHFYKKNNRYMFEDVDKLSTRNCEMERVEN